MTYKQRAEEIVGYCALCGYENDFTKVEQALDEAYARGQQSVLARMPSEEEEISEMLSSKNNASWQNGFLYCAQWLHTKLTEGEG